MTRGTSRLALVLLLGGVATTTVGQPPPAPSPREPATAELLVGRWRLVKYGEKPVQDTSREIMIFTTKGKWSSTYSKLPYPDEMVTGSYKLAGQDIEMTTDHPRGQKHGRLSLVTVTKTQLILQYGEQNGFKRAEYAREEGK